MTGAAALCGKRCHLLQARAQGAAPGAASVRNQREKPPFRSFHRGTAFAPTTARDTEFSMTNADILNVQLSWRKVQPIKDRVAELFYLKLFRMDPGLRILFNDDLDQQ